MFVQVFLRERRILVAKPPVNLKVAVKTPMDTFVMVNVVLEEVVVAIVEEAVLVM